MSGNLELEHETSLHQLANDAHHALSAWLAKQLESVASSIHELQSAQNDPKILMGVQEELGKRPNILATPLKINPITEEDLYQYDSVEPELDGLIKSLKASTPEAATSRKNSYTLLFWKYPYTSSRITTLSALERARLQFGHVTENLESLKVALQLVSVFQKAHLAETRSLRREVKSSKERIAYYEAVHDASSRTSSEETHSIGSRDKLVLIIAARDVSHWTYPQIAQRNPFRDSSSSNKARHDHFHKEWLKGTCGWLINSSEFWDQWLFGDSTTPQIFYCWGPPGAGKSVITSHVIETLQDIGNVYAYYYLGRGFVQSAEGLVLGILSQLCDLEYGSSVERLDDTIHYHLKNRTSPAGVGEVPTPQIVEPSFNSNPSINSSNPPCHDPETTVVTKGSPTGPGEFGDDDSKPTNQAVDSSSPQHKTIDGRKRSLGESHDLLPTLLRALSEVCSKISSPVFIAIDAWDDANMEHLDDFRSVINTLLSSNCRVFLTGREHNSLSLPWPCTQLEIQHQRTSGDIREYVKHVLGNCRHLQDYANSRSYIIHELADTITYISDGSFDFAYTYATGSNSALEGVLNRRGQNREAFGLRKWAFPPMSLREATAQILSAIDVLEPEEFVQSLILLCLLNFPVPISTTALSEALPMISKLFPAVHNPEIPYHDFLAVSKSIRPLINIDPGTQLIHLSSQVVIEQLRDIWDEKWAMRYSELLPRNFTKILTVFCLQYILDWGPKSVDFKKEYGVERLLDESPSLAFVVTSWNSHYKDFLQYMAQLPTSTLTTMGPLPRLTPELPTELSPNQRIEVYKDSSDVGEPDSSVEGMFESTQRNEEQRESVINEDKGEITRLITRLISKYELLQALVLLPIYLGKDPSAAMVPWDEALSWVSSMSELHILSKLGLVNTVRKLGFEISSADAIAKDQLEMTALHIAAQRGIEEDVCALLEAGAQPHTPDRSLKTAMDYAADGHRDGALAYLFENFCEVWSRSNVPPLNIRNLAERYGQYLKAGRETDTPHLSVALMHAAYRSKAGIVRCLLMCGADPNCRDEKGIPVLHHALRNANDQEYPNDTHYIIRKLLRNGADPSITSLNDSAESALHVAARSGSRAAMLELIMCGADVRICDAEGRSPLMVLIEAAVDGTCADFMVRRLLVTGADTEQADKDGRRALHIAAQKGFPIVVLRLVRNFKADVRPRDKEGKTPLDYARKNNRGETIEILEGLMRRM